MYLENFHPVLQAFIATCFTWGMTSLGALVVFFYKKVNRKMLDLMLGFAAGVMIAASFWSLLAPAIEISEELTIPSWIPAVVGFLMGGICLRIIDWILPHLHVTLPMGKVEGVKTRWERSTLLLLAITLHNIPEGLAVGVAFGAVAADLPKASFGGAVALAIGIGIQNFPEGFAVSMPLRGEGLSSKRSFWYAQLSAVVEPIFAVLGATAVTIFHSILPYAFAFAAGAMIFVVVEDVIPAQKGDNTDLATMGAIAGFVIMMLLDLAFG